MLRESLLVKAFLGKRGERAPCWFMRQAGRYLPEYRELRSKHSMLDCIRTPSLATEITLQPLRRFDLDAAIIFADILNPLIGLGAKLDFIQGEGPKIFNPVRTRSEIESIKVPPVEENVEYTLKAISDTAAALTPKGIPVIGFSGAPFTLACYFIQGESSSDFAEARKLMLSDPQSWDMLSKKLVELVSEYLIGQAKAGASAVQLFDSWAGILGPREYKRFVFPYVKSIIARFHAGCDAPLCYFATGASALLPQFAELGADILGVDWRITLSDAAKLTGGSIPLQGNLDPIILQGSKEYLSESVLTILEEGRKLPAHVFNVGHGLTPQTPIDSISTVIELIRR